MSGDGVILNADEYGMDYIKSSISEELTYSNSYFDYDFNNGFRIKFNNFDSNYYVVIKDLKSRYIYFSKIISPQYDTIYSFTKKYFINYEISIHKVEHNLPECYPLEVIKFELQNKNVLILISCSEEKCGLGDGIAWIQSIELFHRKYPLTNIFVCTSYPELNQLISEFMPYINIIEFNNIKEKKFYATYLHGCFYDDKLNDYNPIKYTAQSLIEMGYNVLNVNNNNKVFPEVSFKYYCNKPNKHYICMGIHASGVFKEWLPSSYQMENLIEILKYYGYDVYIIDKNKDNFHNNLIKTSIPKNAIDFTGENISLKERAKLLSGADFFIGCSSGLSWLAWCVGIPVVLISGFTNPITEFYTPYRIINYMKCNSCWNDDTCNPIDNPCPRKQNPFSKEYLECSTSISEFMIFNIVKNIPEFIKYTNKSSINENI